MPSTVVFIINCQSNFKLAYVSQMNGGGHMHLTTFAILPILPPTPICCIFPQTNSSHVSFNLFPPFHPWSTLFTFSIHLMYHCLHQNIFLRSSQNMTILPHTIHPCQFFCCFLQSQHVHQLPCTPLFHQLYTHIALTIDLYALLRIATLFSLKHFVLFPYNIADLTFLLYTFHFTCKKIFFSSCVSPHSEFFPFYAYSCSYFSFTSSTDIQSIAKIAKSLHSFHFITHYFLLHFSSTICCFLTFLTLKSCCT